MKSAVRTWGLDPHHKSPPREATQEQQTSEGSAGLVGSAAGTSGNTDLWDDGRALGRRGRGGSLQARPLWRRFLPGREGEPRHLRAPSASRAVDGGKQDGGKCQHPGEANRYSLFLVCSSRRSRAAICPLSVACAGGARSSEWSFFSCGPLKL